MFQRKAHKHIHDAAGCAERTALDDQHKLALQSVDQQRMTAVEHDRHRTGGGKSLCKRHNAHDPPAAEKLRDHHKRTDRDGGGGCKRHAGAGIEKAVEDQVQHQNAEVDQQRHQRLLHCVVRLVEQVKHGEGAHSERVHAEDIARHLGGFRREAAAFKDHADDIRAKRAHHRADGENEQKRVFRNIPDVAEVAAGVVLRELAVEAREHDGADAVKHGGRQRCEELVRIVERADGAAVERGSGRGVDEVAEKEHRGRQHAHRRGLEIPADIVRAEIQRGAVAVVFLMRIGKAHAELQKPRKGAGDHDAADTEL